MIFNSLYPRHVGYMWINLSSIEMASKGNLGIELNLAVPCREEK